MSRLKRYTGTDFYGRSLRPDVVPGLRCEVRHGTWNGRPYSYIVFLNDEGRIKWRIRPTTPGKRGRARGVPGSLRLYHRNTWGRRGALHSQGEMAWGTRGGPNELLDYVRSHEAYERGEGDG